MRASDGTLEGSTTTTACVCLQESFPSQILSCYFRHHKPLDPSAGVVGLAELTYTHDGSISVTFGIHPVIFLLSPDARNRTAAHQLWVKAQELGEGSGKLADRLRS